MKISKRKLRSIIREEVRKVVSEVDMLESGVNLENAEAVAELVNMTLQKAGYRTQLGRRNSERQATIKVDGVDGLPMVELLFKPANPNARWYYGEIYDLDDKMLGELEIKADGLKQGDMRAVLKNVEQSFQYTADNLKYA
jgi:hypothetical protein